MKRTLESWGTLEKFVLASHIPHSGDPNWGNVSAKTKNVFDEISSYISDEKKPSEWFTEKQCLIQFENLLKSVPKKKRRLEKGIDPADNLHESLVQSLKQEFVQELTKKMSDDQALYLKMVKERDDILAGKLDHKLEDMMGSIEAKEREKEIKMKLKFKIGEKNLDVEVKKENESRINESPTHAEPPKTNVTTSPLLTSLLQSPSPLTRPSIPSSASPTISLLLNSSPSVPTKDSPTLTKLLESSTPISLPQPSTSNSSLLQSPIKAPEKKIEPLVPTPEETVTAAVEEVVTEVENTIKMEEEIESQNVVEDIIESVLESEIIIEEEPKVIEIKKEEKLIEVVPTEGTEEEVMVTVEQIIEKVEEAIIETVGPSSNETCELDLNQTVESETIEENIDCLELDHDAVELIVMGPNQGPVITVRHDTSSETNNEDSGKSDDLKQEEPIAAIESDENEEIVPSNEEKEIKEKEIEEEKPEEKEPEIIEEDVKEEVKKETEEVEPEPERSSESFNLGIEEDNSSDSTLKDVKEEEEDEEEEKSEEVAPAKIELNSPFELTDTTSNDISEPKSVVSSNEDEKTSNDDSQSQPESIPQKETRQSKKQRSQSLETVKEEEELKSSKTDDRTKSFIENLPSTPDSREGKEENEKRRSTRKRTSITLSDSKPSSPSPSTVSNDDDRDYKLWKKSILLVYNRLAAHKFASVFLKPITENEASGYHSVVLKPTDLTKIKRNIENGTIRTTAHFQREMLIMVQNAVMYNKTDTQVHKMAQTMLDDMVAQMEIMVQALGDGVSLRRGYEQKTVTRGRASKVGATEDTPRRKRTSTVEESRPKRKRSDM